ncbi:MAG: hypothetical protein OXE42_17000 [Gammaproteobacteria bacterium]|nr:hypothetical protein [Gammaproteobacteria bacterium]
MHDDVLTGDDNDNKLWGLDGMDRLTGRDGDDTLNGGAGDDTLDGGDDDDTLEGGPGKDMLTGGDDDDTASYAGSTAGVTVRLHASQAMGGHAEGDSWRMITVPYTKPAEDPEDPDVELTETVPDIENLTGSHLADILAGDSRDNTIKGNGGNDKLYGGPGGGNDTLMGDGGDDMLFGGHGNDTLHGGGGDDMLNGGAGDDMFYGGAGSDVIYADSATETASGAAEKDNPMTPFDEKTGNKPGENDTLSFEKVEEKVTVVLEGSSTHISIETLIGTDEDEDELTGTNANPETIEGRDGGDTLDGGTDDVDGTEVGDTVSYKSSDRGVNVTLPAVGAASTTGVSGGHASGDTISNFENVTGSAHDDDLTGNASNNVLKGLDGDDELSGSGGENTLEGGAGEDELDGGDDNADGADEAVDGLDDDPDTLSYANSDAGVRVDLRTNVVSGGDANGDEVEFQSGGENKITPASVDHAAGGTPADDTATPATPARGIQVSTFENVTGSMDDDRLAGDHRMNVLNGGKGKDTLSGRGGADRLEGGPGADRLDGGSSVWDDGGTETAHIDWAVYRGMMIGPDKRGVTVDLDEMEGTAGDADGDTLVNIELVWGSKGNDMFIASSDGDYTNIIHGDGGSDTVSYEASKTGVTVNLDTSTAVAHHTLEAVTVTGTVDKPVIDFPDEDDPAIGDVSAGNDTATNNTDGTANGAAGDRLGSIENLTGSSKDDMLTGDANPNVLKGGDGDDVLNGGDEAASGELPITAGATDTGTVTLGDTLMGGAGDDTLNGDAGNDKLYGGAGDDTLSGGTGTTDSAGNDTFVFSPGNGDDEIVAGGFIGHGETGGGAITDRIDLRAFGIDKDDLPDLIDTRGGNVVIDLGDYGGGSITFTGLDIDQFDAMVDGATAGADTIQSVSVWTDLNGDGDVTDTGESDGIFIL